MKLFLNTDLTKAVRHRIHAVMAALASTGLAAAMLMATPAAARPGDGVSGVTVDVAPLRTRGVGEWADRIGSCLSSRLAAEFADRRSAAGPRLVVRITGLTLTSNDIGGSNVFGSGGSGSDYLEGELLLVSRSGAVIERQPMLSALQASSGGAWYTSGYEMRRVEAICGHFAAWAKRTI